LLCRFFRLGKFERSLYLRRVLLPLACLTAIGMFMTAYYNHAVTGKWTKRPYDLQRETYAVMPHFIWRNPSPVPPAYRYPEIRSFYTQWETAYGRIEGVRSYVERKLIDLTRMWTFYFGAALTLPALAGLYAIWNKSRRMFVLLAAGSVMVPWLIIRWPLNAHYLSPFAGLFYLAVCRGLSAMCRNETPWRRAGLGLAILTPLLCLISLVVRVGSEVSLPRSVSNPLTAHVFYPRADLLRVLRQLPGKHLVTVRYSEDHSPNEEWVFNSAEIDASNVVWAREGNRLDTDKLASYFQDRTMWLVDVAPDRVELRPFGCGVSCPESRVWIRGK